MVAVVSRPAQTRAPRRRRPAEVAEREILTAAEALLRERPEAARAHVARWLGARHELLKA